MAKGKYQEWLEEDKLILIEGWARDGLTEEQIAHNMGVSLSSLKDWKNKFPTIMTALKKGKEVVDFEVECALLKRALGYTYEEVTTEQGVSQTGKQINIVRKTIKAVLPDVTAQIFWLKNRRPDKWRDKPAEVSINTTDDTGVIILPTRKIEEENT